MDNKNIINEFKSNNKNLQNISEELKKQNTKLENINGNVDVIDEKTKITNKYLNGFTNFFGFFSNIFDFSHKKQNEKKESLNSFLDTYQNEKKNDFDYLNKVIDEDEMLKNEIFEMNKNMKEIKNLTKLGNKHADILEKKIDKTSNKINDINTKSKLILEN